MSFVTWKLEHTPFDSDEETYGTKYTLSNYFNPILNMKIGDGRDSFKLEVTNINGSYDTTFNPNDKIVISRVVNNSTFTTSDVLMNGALRDIPEELSSSKNNIKMNGFNYSETIMGTLIPVLSSTSWTPAYAIQQALAWASGHNSNFKVTWNTNNPTSKYSADGVKNAGGSFPNVNKKFYYKTIKQILEDLSKETYTEDGKYYWYVDENNTLIWDKRIDSDIYSFDSSTDNFKRLKVKKDIKDVKNFIIMKGGRDAKQSPISFPSTDYVSIAKHGFKFLVYVSTSAVGGDLIDVDAKSSTINGSSVADIESFFDAGGSYTVPWKINGVANTYTSFDDYNSGLRVFIKQELKKEGSEMLATRAFGTLSVEIDRSPLDGLWGLGSVIACKISNLGSVVKNMRVEEVQYTSVSDTYILKEDKGSI